MDLRMDRSQVERKQCGVLQESESTRKGLDWTHGTHSSRRKLFWMVRSDRAGGNNFGKFQMPVRGRGLLQGKLDIDTKY